ncbi:hypothetical protein D9757_000255 [Collybiopsis confluens]|uniref:Protein transport protein SEC22 n=1 Tax=Collybiopsis confluens TaxID=2823264 RepID=A0A8H5MH95_9AGAR|nr:hypothetical protein D9757_000255 [Collybiopsis confluens]
MVRSTIIVRASDALPLAASVDDEQTEQALQEHKQQSKLIFRRISPNSEPRCSIESGQYTLHYLIADNVVFLTIADKSYPRKLAFSYLDELSKEFATSYGPKVETVRKPYAFVGFDTFMSKTTRLYQDTRTATAANSSGLNKLNDELQDVTRIMTKNMEELLWRGDSLDRMSHLSTSLRSESEKYRKTARNINLQAMLRQSPSPYGSQHAAPVESHYSASPYGAPPQSAGGGATITPGSITYTTSNGPDGQIVYHPFKAVPASYQTPTGVVTGIQWVPAEATHILPNGAQPASIVTLRISPKHGTEETSVKKTKKISEIGKQRSEDKRRKKEEKESIKLLKERDRYSQSRYDNDPDLRMARERDSVVSAQQRRKSFSQGAGLPAPPVAVTFPSSAGGGTPGAYPTPGGYTVPGAYTASSAVPGVTYARERKYSTGGSLVDQFADLGLERESNLPHGSLARPHKYNTHEATAERTRRMSGNFGIERPPSASGYGKPYVPGTGYSNPSPGPPPYMVGSRPSSPYGPPVADPYGGNSTPYGARAASPYHRAPSPFHRSPSPFAGDLYPSGHVLEGRPMTGAPARSRASSPNPGGMPGPYPTTPSAMPGTLAAPECFSRPLNAAHPYTPFEPMRIQDMDLFLEMLPGMPVVLQTHDVYNEDWSRCMDDVALAWSGRLPLPVPPIHGKAPKRATLAAKLIELWNHSFFERRGVELVLYKGRERRSGPQYGLVDMPYHNDDDSSSSSSSSDSDDDPRLMGFYGGHGSQSAFDGAGTRRNAAKAEKQRRKREKKQRRKEREKRYSLFLFCLPQGGPGGVGSVYGTPALAAGSVSAYGKHSPALTASALRGVSPAAAVSGSAYAMHVASAYPGTTSATPAAVYGAHSPSLRGHSPSPGFTSTYPGMLPI